VWDRSNAKQEDTVYKWLRNIENLLSFSSLRTCTCLSLFVLIIGTDLLYCLYEKQVFLLLLFSYSYLIKNIFYIIVEREKLRL